MEDVRSFEPSRRFRVEHRRDDTVVSVLGHVEGAFPHHDTLTPYVSRILRDAFEMVAGEVVLVDEATDQVLARRSLERGMSPRRVTAPRPRQAS